MMARLIESSAVASPRLKRINERFGQVGIGLLVNGEPRRIRPVGSPPTDPTNQVNICVVPEDGEKTKGFSVTLWNSTRELMIIPAITCPDSVFKAIIYHELGHACRHNSLDGNPVYPFKSDEYAAEEVEMHELGGEILDSESKGAYQARIREILGRTRAAKSFDQALCGLTRDDLAYFDALFGTDKMEVPSFQLTSQCLLGVGFAYCDERHLGMKGKIEVYKWFGKYVSSLPIE
jgi:hypothetical protein